MNGCRASKAVYKKFKPTMCRARSRQITWPGARSPKVDRIEWVVMPERRDRGVSLMAGEVDWLERPAGRPASDAAKAQDITVRAVDPFGMQTMLRFNHIHPPFNNPAIRRAVMATVSQPEYMQVTAGGETPEICRSFYLCGTKFATDQGAGDWLKEKEIEKAKALLAEGGYAGEKVVILDPTDHAVPHNQTIVTVANLREIGMNVEVRATDAGSLFALAGKKEPVEQGGWSLFHTTADSTNYSVPTLNNALRAGGEKDASVGWPSNEKIQALRAQFLSAMDPEEHKKIAAAIQEEAYNDVIYVLTGQYREATAYNKRVKGMIDSPIPVFWNISVEQ
jgi:peptide/nickel transport system substrate-binding protein